ncbi:hypothetical protein [uncultured Tenacibaculum sp.]|uniref:hypothetical protein n=1 Tax=uncultured Tenacibaculum sp. TaxID=174713 RepID=UPI00260A276E|nr:hypothetical protein [uncultured Tenacibaculum sp.]
MKTIFLLLSFIALASCSSTKYNQQIQASSETQIINSLLDSIYTIKLCYPDYRFSNKSNKKFRVNKRRLSSIEERDTIQKIVLLKDNSLDELFLEEKTKSYVKRRLGETSIAYQVIKNSEKLVSLQFNPELLKQKRVEFLTKKQAEFRNINTSRFGKQDSILNVGFMYFSRVYYSPKHNYGFFKYTYIGRGTCGFNALIFFSKKKEKWHYEQTFGLGVF